MYVIQRKDGWFVYEISSGGCFCLPEFNSERIIFFEYRFAALTLLSFIEGFYPGMFDVVYIPETDPRISDLILEEFYF